MLQTPSSEIVEMNIIGSGMKDSPVNGLRRGLDPDLI